MVQPVAENVFRLNRGGGAQNVSCQVACDELKERARVFKCYTFENGNDDAIDRGRVPENEIDCEGTFFVPLLSVSSYLTAFFTPFF